MTDKEFISWLRELLNKTNIKDLESQRVISDDYNHSTILRSIYNKLQTVEKGSIYPLTGGLGETGPRN